MSQIRREVLKAFKQLHRAREHVFRGDLTALVEGRKEINAYFRKNRDETNEDEIKKMIQLAYDVEQELRRNVIQAVQEEEGLFHVRITEETTRLDNTPFNPDALEDYLRKTASTGKKTKARSSCQETASGKETAAADKLSS